METAVEEKQQEALEAPPALPPFECTRANKAKNLTYKQSVSLFCPTPNCMTKLVYMDAKGSHVLHSLSMRGGKTILKCSKCQQECWTDRKIL